MDVRDSDKRASLLTTQAKMCDLIENFMVVLFQLVIANGLSTNEGKLMKR
jgi:hypothetical protein